MSSRDLVFLGVGVLLAVVGIGASFLGSDAIGMTALFILALLVLFLLVLQRRYQSRVQERILYLVDAEKKRKHNKDVDDKGAVKSRLEPDAVLTKKIIGILQAQQISMERLRREIKDDSE